jgi:acyl-CoA synthetase (AMP-forming)/AMP-acid ligase II
MTVSANLASVLDASADGKQVAVIDLSGSAPVSYSYADLRRRANALGAALRRDYPGARRVALLCGNSARFLAAWLGAMRIGCTVVPINTRAGAESIRHCCTDAAVDLVLTEGTAVDGVPSGIPTIDVLGDVFDTWWSDDAMAPEASEGGPALVLYTSGSTGRPKGVVLSHSSQLAILAGLDSPSLRAVLARGPSIVAAPLFHMNGLLLTALSLSVGATVVLLRKFEADRFLSAIAEYRVTVVTGVPTMLALVASSARGKALDVSSVELVMIGSAPLAEPVLAQARALFPRATVLNSYGTTEIGAGMFGAHPEGVSRPPLSVGHPTQTASVRLVHGASPDEGVLEVRGPTTMDGYLNLPEATAAKVKNGWINTGDVFRRDAAGFYYFVGRTDDMFVCGGENVYPGEVERAIERHPDVLQSVVVPLQDDVRGAVPVAFVVARPGSQLSTDDIKQHVLGVAAPHLHPRKVWFVDSLPLSSANKIDRRELIRRASLTDASANTGAA